MTLSDDVVRRLYRTMVAIREFELKVQEIYRSGVMPGFIHLYVGQEAVAAGVCAHLGPRDYATSTHRGHGHALAQGVPMNELFAEIWGRPRGCNGGRGGSMHIYEPACGFLGTNGIVAAGIPLAAGAALAARLRGESQVAVSFFGDGAVNNCAFHEGVNLAAVWDLPVVFVCENNLYATETPLSAATRNIDIASRGAAYGLPGVAVDGNDVTAVYEAAGRAVSRARAGEGPTLIECRTYRVTGHFEGDPGTGYRTKEEVAEWRTRDPLPQFRREAAARVPEVELDAIDRAVRAEVDAAYRFALESPEADPASVTEHVYG